MCIPMHVTGIMAGRPVNNMFHSPPEEWLISAAVVDRKDEEWMKNEYYMPNCEY